MGIENRTLIIKPPNKENNLKIALRLFIKIKVGGKQRIE